MNELGMFTKSSSVKLLKYVADFGLSQTDQCSYNVFGIFQFKGINKLVKCL
jgi:hypothetical protein